MTQLNSERAEKKTYRPVELYCKIPSGVDNLAFRGIADDGILSEGEGGKNEEE